MTVQPQSAHSADVSPIKTISKIWLIPIIALLVGIWMVYYQWSNQGPLITIELSSATGLEPGKTKIKARNVDVGEVRSINLKAESDGVRVTARMSSDTYHLLKQDTEFWVVTPKVTISGVTGLTTLLSGPYIELSPGESDQSATTFIGLDEPPVTPSGTPGLFITLSSNEEFAFKRGDPVIYKGLTVGQFEHIYFNFDERVVYYNVFIKAPYHQLITSNTRFWNASGVTVDLASTGVTVQTGNLETLLTNGVTFDVPDGIPLGELISTRAEFKIFKDQEEATAARFQQGAEYVILISDTVRGLNVGAPVEYRGIQVGQVVDIAIDHSQSTSLLEEGYRIPVIISIQPGRVGLPDNPEGLAHIREQTQVWLKNGFRAALKNGNLLTGAQFVELQFYDDQPISEETHFLGYEVIPTVSDEFTQITQKITAVLDKLNRVPFDELGLQMAETLDQFIETAESMRQTSDDFDFLATDEETLNIASTLNETLSNMNKLLSDYNGNSDAYSSLSEAMTALTTAIQNAQPLLHQLNNSPNSLVFGSKSGKEVTPQATPKGNQ